MRTLAQKPKAVQQTTSVIPGRAHCGQNRELNSKLYLQSTIGNQAVQRMLQTNAEELKAGLTGTASPGFEHDFSRIPIHPPAVGAIQAKLAINQPGDASEQEADRISEQVMRMPEPQQQRACGCSGGCSKCQAEQSDHEHGLQTRHVQASDTGQASLSPIVHRVLAAPGHPLDPATRAFFEVRFGHDFSHVRIHRGIDAEKSAHALDARAYTAGQHIVFAASHNSLDQFEGRKLLAHELAHVVQQNTSYAAPGIVQRSPGNKPVDSGTGVPKDLLLWSTAVWPRRLDSDQEILTLAANPDHAHRRWKGLAPQAQIWVALNMARFYGAPFAKQFVDIHKAAKVPENVYRMVGVDTTPAQLTARGFHLAGWQAQMNVEIWFHPSGSRLHRLIPSGSAPEPVPDSKSQDQGEKRPPPAPESPPRPPDRKPPSDKCPEIQSLSDAICDNAGRICRIADELGDDAAARASCQKAQRMCQEAQKRTETCGPPAVS
jgi:hypothetical protein